MDTPDHILVVDDDRQLLDLVARYLADSGLRVSPARDAVQARAVMASARIDLVVLDLMLPGEDGLSLCRWLRSRADVHVPILMLTARAEETDRVVGLEMGADDYLAKPFATRELLARIRAVLRRTRMLPPNLQPVHQARALRFGDWTLDTTARHLLDAQGTLVSLTGGEFRLLRVLLDHPQRVLHRDQLLNLTQGRDTEAFDRSIDLLISRLRQRLRDDPREPRYIKTVRNEGYVLCAEVVAA
ncbi:winged helix family two component transcriptional regulator [Aquabacterium commune]|uniref:Winged helix family two component transcriptional regulator n=1 Tax=Aquabacterium commune TaxID=70586 RepID=A0A4R6RQQ6_9BURK|nr:response regulator [Aquabacterium commune]TDP88595.1 winged helix family two component transcriptional regulator [Aquabacterium commune]